MVSDGITKKMTKCVLIFLHVEIWGNPKGKKETEHVEGALNIFKAD